jgi:hypothetical protein
MLSQLPRIAVFALVVYPFLAGCSHAAHNSLANGSAPGLKNDDAPLLRTEGNPNAPYLVAAAKPQLLKRPESGDTSAAGPCDSRDLTVTEIAASVNGDYHAVKLAFYNQGLAPCRISGFPTVSLLDKNGETCPGAGSVGLGHTPAQAADCSSRRSLVSDGMDHG